MNQEIIVNTLRENGRFGLANRVQLLTPLEFEMRATILVYHHVEEIF